MNGQTRFFWTHSKIAWSHDSSERNNLTLMLSIRKMKKKCCIYLKTPLSGLFWLFLRTISILLFFYYLQRKQFVCFEPYFSFIECATKKSHRGEFLDILKTQTNHHPLSFERSATKTVKIRSDYSRLFQKIFLKLWKSTFPKEIVSWSWCSLREER